MVAKGEATTFVYPGPHSEERALARVSKDGRESALCVHPSRRLLRKLLRMRSEIYSQPRAPLARRRSDHLQRGRHHRDEACAGRPDRVRTVKPAPLRIGLEGIGYSDDGFSRAQRQDAIGLDHPGKAIEDADLGLLIEINQDVAAEDHVERS